MDSALAIDGFLPFLGDHRRRRGADDRLVASARDRDPEGTQGSGPGDVEALKLSFPASAEAPQLARRSLDTLEKSLDGDRLYELRLLVTELVTNSVRHAGLGPSDWIGFEVAVTSERTRIEVSDRGHGFEDTSPPTAREGDDSTDDPVLAARGSGWGFHLVEQLSDRWGISHRGETRVWFELDAPGARDVADPSVAAA